MAKTILFDASKNELFQIKENYKSVHRKLTTNNWKVETNHKPLTGEALQRCSVLVLAGPRAPYTEAECAHMKSFIETGGGCLVLLAEGGEAQLNTNVNFLLEDFGMSVNADCTVRTQYYKYLHPKECMIGGGIRCQPLWRHLLDQPNATRAVPFAFSEKRDQLHFVYPFGATLTVRSPAQALCTTGACVYPFHRPVIGYYGVGTGGGRLLVSGSGHMFHDRYIGAEQTNAILWEYFVGLLSNTEDQQRPFTVYDFSDADAPMAAEADGLVPDTAHLAEQPKMCLLESIDCDVPSDFKKVFDMRLHSISNALVPQMIGLHRQLGVQYEPLRIIKPQFEIPLPALQMAVFQPVFSDAVAPGLELFDLDEAFSSERTQLTQLVTKCLSVAGDGDEGRKAATGSSRELEYFVLECGRILGVTTSDEQKQRNGKEVLYEMGVRIAKYKKLDRE